MPHPDAIQKGSNAGLNVWGGSRSTLQVGIPSRPSSCCPYCGLGSLQLILASVSDSGSSFTKNPISDTLVGLLSLPRECQLI